MRMALFNLTDLCDGLTRGQCLLGLDPGARTIGLALSDVRLRLAGPYGQLRRGKLAHNAAEVLAITQREGAGGLVVGLPLNLDGGFGPAAQAARDWARALSDATGLPATLWDERLTTSSVHDLLIEQAQLRPARRAAAVDRLAAAQILQAALDAWQKARNPAASEGFDERHNI
jgi:putative Holliday junction resolvase